MQRQKLNPGAALSFLDGVVAQVPLNREDCHKVENAVNTLRYTLQEFQRLMEAQRTEETMGADDNEDTKE